MERSFSIFAITALILAAVFGFSKIASGEVKLLHTLEQQIAPKETALLVIDIQNDFFSDRGKFAKIGIHPKVPIDSFSRMNRLIKEARKAGVMVIWIRVNHLLKDTLPNFMVLFTAKNKGKTLTENNLPALEGSWGAEHYDKIMKPLTGEIEVIKNNYGAFTNTKLETCLKANGIKTIIYTGLAMDVCILSTVIEGWMRGYYCILPPDCVLYFNEPLYEALLKNHKRYFGYTPKSNEIINIWKKAAP